MGTVVKSSKNKMLIVNGIGAALRILSPRLAKNLQTDN